MPTPTPIALTEAEYEVVMEAAGPIHPHQRHAFLAALAAELGRHETRGVGLVHRCAAELQRKFVLSARSAASPTAQRTA